ncbi:MAG: peptide chain release factor N(5)-glutamine methyltransferase [Desulfatiglandaceae bacterium]
MTKKSWQVKGLLEAATGYLKKKEIHNPRLDAEVLLAHLLKVDRLNLYLNIEQPLTEKEVSGYRSLIQRRSLREPLQYITGVQEFWSLDFRVNSQVLIPRPETELLVGQALARIRTTAGFQTEGGKMLDLGTGCGAVAISLAKELPEARLWASDISAGALEIARINAERHRVSERIEFRQGDLWEPFINHDITFDIILSNPPYIASEDYDELPPEVRDYEPRLALDGGKEGMSYIEKIVKGGVDYLKEGGWLILEMAPEQTDEALRLTGQTNGYSERDRIKDYSHRYRVVLARKAKSSGQTKMSASTSFPLSVKGAGI